jgi:hypothetical protein
MGTFKPKKDQQNLAQNSASETTVECGHAIHENKDLRTFLKIRTKSVLIRI